MKYKPGPSNGGHPNGLEMGTSNDLSVIVGRAKDDDAAERAKGDQSVLESYPRFLDDPRTGDAGYPFRSVSEGEGIAAFALLACGQQPSTAGSARPNGGRGGSDLISNNIGNSNASGGRVDSSAWGYLLASGGESIPQIIPRSVSRSEKNDSDYNGGNACGSSTDQRSTSSSSSASGSSGGGGGGGIDIGVGGTANTYQRQHELQQQQRLELGPMPTRRPFEGSKPGSIVGDGRGAGGKSKRKSSGSSSSPLRPYHNMNTLQQMLSLETTSSSSASSQNIGHVSNGVLNTGTTVHSGIVGGATTAYDETITSPSGGGEEGSPWSANRGDHSPTPARQHSFDPNMDIPHQTALLPTNPPWSRTTGSDTSKQVSCAFDADVTSSADTRNKRHLNDSTGASERRDNSLFLAATLLGGEAAPSTSPPPMRMAQTWPKSNGSSTVPASANVASSNSSGITGSRVKRARVEGAQPSSPVDRLASRPSWLPVAPAMAQQGRADDGAQWASKASSSFGLLASMIPNLAKMNSGRGGGACGAGVPPRGGGTWSRNTEVQNAAGELEAPVAEGVDRSQMHGMAVSGEGGHVSPRLIRASQAESPGGGGAIVGSGVQLHGSVHGPGVDANEVDGGRRGHSATHPMTARQVRERARICSQCLIMFPRSSSIVISVREVLSQVSPLVRVSHFGPSSCFFPPSWLG